MVLFFTVVISIYTAMHGVVFWGVSPLVAGWNKVTFSLLLWMALMIIAPFAVRLLEAGGNEQAARILALVGFNWMGLVFLAGCLFAAVGALDLLCRLLQLFIYLPRFSLHVPLTSVLVLFLTLAAGLYGNSEAKNIRVETVPIITDRLGPEIDRLRLVQVSDLHLGLLNRDEFLQPVINRIKELKPDLLVVTGDMVDGRIIHLPGLYSLWQEIEPPLGKFAITGNHEVYAGLGQSIDFLHRSGFTVLRNIGINIKGMVTLVGLDDEAVPGAAVDEHALLQAHASDLFTLYLRHRPTVTAADADLFDLQLSGHAHRGQIFPFKFVTGLRYPMQNGLYQLTARGSLYASRGTGTWGPPMRLLSPPEITVFEISRAGAGQP
jgi:hypothetical protein